MNYSKSKSDLCWDSFQKEMLEIRAALAECHENGTNKSRTTKDGKNEMAESHLGGPLQKLADAYPGSLEMIDPQTGLYPFMLAATVIPGNKDRTHSTRTCLDAEDDFQEKTLNNFVWRKRYNRGFFISLFGLFCGIVVLLVRSNFV